jgi:molybdopterin-guanine dinucleotide biosynthesis protein B
MLIINIIGAGRKRGKTKLIEVLIKELTQMKYHVSTIKHISKGSFDTTQKDTWRHLKAGAKKVIAISRNELVCIQNINSPLLDTAIAELGNHADIVLIEGFKKAPYPKIIVAKTISDVKKLMNEVNSVIAITGAISKKSELQHYQKIPIYDPLQLVNVLVRMIIND